MGSNVCLLAFGTRVRVRIAGQRRSCWRTISIYCPVGRKARHATQEDPAQADGRGTESRRARQQPIRRRPVIRPPSGVIAPPSLVRVSGYGERRKSAQSIEREPRVGWFPPPRVGGQALGVRSMVSTLLRGKTGGGSEGCLSGVFPDNVDDDAPDLLAEIHAAVGFGHLLEGPTTVEHGADRSSLHETREEFELLGGGVGCGRHNPAAALHRGPQLYPLPVESDPLPLLGGRTGCADGAETPGTNWLRAAPGHGPGFCAGGVLAARI